MSEHHHSHEHEGRSHGVSADADRGKLAIALGLIVAFMAVEVTVGILSSSSGFPAMSAHVLVGVQDNCHAARRHLEALLHDQFEIEHTTLQVDHDGGELLQIEDLGPHPAGVPAY